VSNLEAMNASGGGTNKPKIVQKRIYAEGGGLIGENKEIRKNYDAQYGPGAYDTDSAIKKSSIQHKDTAGTKLNKSQPTFGPSAMPAMSTQADMNALASKITFDERLKKVKGQMQARKALSLGKGLGIKGASTGRDLGTGYGATYKNRDAIVTKGNSSKMDLSITLGGKEYYGMKKGNDVVYVATRSKRCWWWRNVPTWRNVWWSKKCLQDLIMQHQKENIILLQIKKHMEV